MTPGKSIRAFCLACAGSAAEVRRCGGDHCIGGQGDGRGRCYFYNFRLGKGRPSLRLIRKLCLECSGHSPTTVAECSSRECPLHRFRFGRRPEKTSPETLTAEGGLAPRIDGATSRGTDVPAALRSSIVRTEIPVTAMDEAGIH